MKVDTGAEMIFLQPRVNNVRGPEIRNVYSKTVINNITVKHYYNGGTGGVAARPTAQEQTASWQQPHQPPTHLQSEHRVSAFAPGVARFG
jgi:hypothetical protein